jgi:ATP-dependent Clp protease protease subunit
MNPWYRFENAAGTPRLYIYEDIGESWFAEDPLTSKRFAEDLEALGKVKEINVRINSPGGSVFDARAMASLLRDHPARIVVDIDGVCASAATYIACMGDECRIAEDGVYMIHNPNGICVGEAADMLKTAEALNVVREGMVGMYARRTKQKPEKIGELLDAETWMTAQEAKEYGFVDSVTDQPMKLAASVNRAKLSNMTLPYKIPDAMKDHVKVAGETEAMETRIDSEDGVMKIPENAFRKREADEARKLVEIMAAKVRKTA